MKDTWVMGLGVTEAERWDGERMHGVGGDGGALEQERPLASLGGYRA